jgi:hypothetical protein
MAVRIRVGTRVVECDTVAEARELLAGLNDAPRPFSVDNYAKDAGVIAGLDNVASFHAFMNSIGPSQLLLLGLLIDRQTATDVELCKELGLLGPQALAGVLSGITQQANKARISPRSIFGWHQIYKSGVVRSKVYFVTQEFVNTLKASGWSPPQSHQPPKKKTASKP